MKSRVQKAILVILLFITSLPAFAQVDLKVVQQGNFVSLDTLTLTVDTNDYSGTGANAMYVYFRVYNLSPTNAEAFYLEAEWLCSNSSVHYQLCQEYPPDYLSGTCQTFHREGIRKYDGYNYLIPPDTCDYNYLKCYIKVYDYSVEKEHEKVCRFTVKRRNTHQVLDVMYLVVRRGNLPCHTKQPVGIPAGSFTDEVAAVYPNPARSSFTIAAEQDQLVGCSLYATDGRVIWNKHIAHSKSVNINVAALSNGIYYLKLNNRAGKTFYKKIVVDH